MITVNGWCAGGKGGVSVQSMGEMGKDFLQPFLIFSTILVMEPVYRRQL